MGTKVQKISKGDYVKATCSVYPRNRSYYGSTPRVKGSTGRVNAVSGDAIRFSQYGDWYPMASFERTTELAVAQAVVAKIDEQLKAINKRRDAAVAKVENLKNPPWKKGDKCRFVANGGIYTIHHIDDESVTYKGSTGAFYASALEEFQKTAKRA